MNEYPKYYLVENQDFVIHPEIILTEKELESFERLNFSNIYREINSDYYYEILDCYCYYLKYLDMQKEMRKELFMINSEM